MPTDALARTNRVLRTLRAGHRTLLRATDEKGLLQAMCRVLVDEGGYKIVWIGYAEHDQAKSIRPIGHAGLEADFFRGGALFVGCGATERIGPKRSAPASRRSGAGSVAIRC